MARGGYRANAGRPPNGGRKKALVEAKKASADLKLSPLEYMLKVMNDDSADAMRRDRMAVAAAPFVHAKPGEKALGKKEAAEEAGKTAGAGTDWGDDLAGPGASLN